MQSPVGASCANIGYASPPEISLMRPLIQMSLAAAGIGAALVLSPSPGHAGTIGNAPWCAVQNLGAGDIVWDCEFMTAEQCQPAVIAGNRGYCNLNPASPPYQPAPPVARSHKRHHHSAAQNPG